MNKNTFDQLFDQSFEQAATKTSIPQHLDHQLAWQKVQQKINSSNKKKKSFSRYKIAISIAASMLFGSILFGLPMFSDALDPIKSKISTTQDGFTNVFTGDKQDTSNIALGMKTAPPPEDHWNAPEDHSSILDPDRFVRNYDVVQDEEHEIEYEVIDTKTGEVRVRVIKDEKQELHYDDWETFKENNEYPVPDLMYIPEILELDQIRVHYSLDKPYMSFARFNHAKSKNRTSFRIHWKNSNQHHRSIPNPNAVIEELTLNNGMKAMMITFKDESHVIIDIMDDRILYSLSSVNIPKKEAIKIMENIKVTEPYFR